MSKITNNNDIIQELIDILQNKATHGGIDTTDATATAEDILVDKTAYVSGQKITGTIAFAPAKTITPGTSSQIAVSSGYYTGGNITVAGDSNLVADNIKKGISIFGVNGNYEGNGEVDYSVEDSLVTKDFTTYTNDRVTKIGDCAFYSCSRLTSVSFPLCSYIGSYAFSGCVSLTSVNFPVCSYIDKVAFSSCKNLTSVSFPVCLYIASLAFYSCKNLTSANFPMCSYIDGAAFGYCLTLTSVNFPVCLYVDGNAFSHCKRLASISFPICSYIGVSAFFNCQTLTSVSFPACTSMENGAFRSCTRLTSADFGGNSTVSKCVIYSSVFLSCKSLTNLTLRYSIVATLSNINTFTDTPMSLSTLTGSFGSIYVPLSLVDAYKAATNWATYADRITAIVE